MRKAFALRKNGTVKKYYELARFSKHLQTDKSWSVGLSIHTVIRAALTQCTHYYLSYQHARIRKALLHTKPPAPNASSHEWESKWKLTPLKVGAFRLPIREIRDFGGDLQTVARGEISFSFFQDLIFDILKTGTKNRVKWFKIEL